MDAKKIKEAAGILVDTILKECASNNIIPNELEYDLLTGEEWLSKKPQHKIFIYHPELNNESSWDIDSLQILHMLVVTGVNKYLSEKKFSTINLDNLKEMQGNYFCAYS